MKKAASRGRGGIPIVHDCQNRAKVSFIFPNNLRIEGMEAIFYRQSKLNVVVLMPHRLCISDLDSYVLFLFCFGVFSLFQLLLHLSLCDTVCGPKAG